MVERPREVNLLEVLGRLCVLEPLRHPVRRQPIFNSVTNRWARIGEARERIGLGCVLVMVAIRPAGQLGANCACRRQPRLQAPTWAAQHTRTHVGWLHTRSALLWDPALRARHAVPPGAYYYPPLARVTTLARPTAGHGCEVAGRAMSDDTGSPRASSST